jgi:hypothetical protein
MRESDRREREGGSESESRRGERGDGGEIKRNRGVI